MEKILCQKFDLVLLNIICYGAHSQAWRTKAQVISAEFFENV